MTIIPLTKACAEEHAETLTRLTQQIPLAVHTKEGLLAESMEKRLFYHKWDHSLMALDGETPIAVAVGYERAAEGNDQYPQHSLYLAALAVDSAHQKQGVGKALLKEWIIYNTKIGFLHFDAPLSFSVQTNMAPWNAHVQEMYKKVGFKECAIKHYDNRVDFVFTYTPNKIS